jgi:hypothetical protein
MSIYINKNKHINIYKQQNQHNKEIPSPRRANTEKQTCRSAPAVWGIHMFMIQIWVFF